MVVPRRDTNPTCGVLRNLESPTNILIWKFSIRLPQDNLDANRLEIVSFPFQNLQGSTRETMEPIFTQIMK